MIPTQDATNRVWRAGLIAMSVVIGLLIVRMWWLRKVTPISGNEVKERVVDKTAAPPPPDWKPTSYLPVSNTGMVVRHAYFSLSFDAARCQPEWVAYQLTKSMVNSLRPNREAPLLPDPEIRGVCAHATAYQNEIMEAGQLVPAADMVFDAGALSDTWLTSNQTPMNREFRSGVWRELEETVRDWARQRGSLIVITGPVFETGSETKDKIGQVPVPRAFYKIVLSGQTGRHQLLAFLVPNRPSGQPLSSFTVPVNQVEALTGLDFFYQYLRPREESVLEAGNDPSAWYFSDKRHLRRGG